MASPYDGKEIGEWKSITEELIEKHPLSLDEIREIVLSSWDILWNTEIGSGDTSFPLKEIDMPSTVIGYFLEKLISRELERKYPEKWKGNIEKREKDFVYIPSPNEFSIEMKTSGQAGTSVFGNRSYGKEGEGSGLKGKSGYYLTVNFFGRTLFLIRFGWIDHSDWTSQNAETGQAATLGSDVYEHKLIDIPGEYQKNAPVLILPRVGTVTKKLLKSKEIHTVQDLIEYQGKDSKIKSLKKTAKEFTGDKNRNTNAQGTIEFGPH